MLAELDYGDMRDNLPDELVDELLARSLPMLAKRSEQMI
jgi:hypothetical protein